jgi:hypothetical protein
MASNITLAKTSHRLRKGFLSLRRVCDREMSNQEGIARFLIGIGWEPDKEMDCGNEGAKNLRLKKREKPKRN